MLLNKTGYCLLFTSLEYFLESLFLLSGVCRTHINIEALDNSMLMYSISFWYLCWFKLCHALWAGSIVVIFNGSGFWVKVEKSQILLAKDLIKESHCYIIFVRTYSGTALFFCQFIPLWLLNTAWVFHDIEIWQGAKKWVKNPLSLSTEIMFLYYIFGKDAYFHCIYL